ncbi:MAG: amidohydrolase family protein [Bacteroidota bacterium]|jgi:N-acetylglucosamine-6-phosphate deacetylase|nr:amidohydrolase family protein [Bacteroidota bacterium]
MSERSIKGKIVLNDRILEGHLIVEGGEITRITPQRPQGEIINMGNAFIVPEFIDLHIHGIHQMLVDNSTEDLKQICKTLPQYGVTGYLPTLSPRPKGEDATFLSKLSKTETEGAEILGFHLEGPFLMITGALGAEAISRADEERVNALIDTAKSCKAIFSISPDVSGIEKLILLMAAGGTPVFMTHTAATVEQTQQAIALGARHVTHFYNVFLSPAVSEPGVRPCGAMETILADERVSVNFILDGVHVDPVAAKMALISKRRGSGKVCLVTDANVGAGLEPWQFSFGDSGDIYFEYKGTSARSMKDNTFAVSELTIDQALRNAVKWLDLNLVQTSELVSHHPAPVLRQDRA